MFSLTVDREIHVRTLHPNDAEALFILLEQNRDRLRPWIDPSALPETLQATRNYTIECLSNSLEDPLVALEEYGDLFAELDDYISPLSPLMEMGIWMKESLVGELMIGRQEDSFTTAEFGYWISREMEGFGIITRSVSALMDYAIENMGIEQFEIGCAVTNVRSRAIPERLGYRLQATIPGGEVVGKYIYDRVIYGIRSNTWRKQRYGFARKVQDDLQSAA